MGHKLLLVDDDNNIRRFYKEFFIDNGFDVIEADNAKTGMDFFKEYVPDLVLLDIDMPGKSGLDLLREIKRYNEGVPVFMLTAHEEYKRDFSSLYAEEYYTKSHNPEKILKKIKEKLTVK